MEVVVHNICRVVVTLIGDTFLATFAHGDETGINLEEDSQSCACDQLRRRIYIASFLPHNVKE